jgi:hypothetical protein
MIPRCKCAGCRHARLLRRLRVAIVLFILLVAGFVVTLGSQTTQIAAPKLAHVYAGDPGDELLSSWTYVKACSGAKEQKGGRYHDIHWFVISPHGLDRGDSSRIVGRWVFPDTIYIDSLYMGSSWVIQHEMLHHLLRGPEIPVGGNPQDVHPATSFVVPCMLMGPQNVPEEQPNFLKSRTP